jgi:arabinogalactan endo-1,4-beta-galactosidase
MKTTIHYLFLLPLLLLGCAKQATKPGLTLTAKTVGARALNVDGIPSFFAMGADASFIPQMEAAGFIFKNRSGATEDGLQVLKEEGVNSIRLRVFVNPKSGFCTTAHMVAMAVRAKAKGFHIMIDFHYSDTWANRGAQKIPAGWPTDSLSKLETTMYNYTYHVMDTLKSVGVTPDWVQVGNEINSGILFPLGAASNYGNLAQLINQGYAAIKAVSPTTKVIIHIAGDTEKNEAAFFDGLTNHGANFDILAFSYYPNDNGQTYAENNAGMGSSLADLAARYNKPVMLAETGALWTDSVNTYNGLNDAINRISSISGAKGAGIFYWEPESYYVTGNHGNTQNAFDPVTMAPTIGMNAFLYNPANNLLTNADFEDGGLQSGTISGWTVLTNGNNDAVYTTTGGYTRTYRLSHYKTTAYHAFTYQDLTGVPTGMYMLTAWIQSSGGQNTCVMYAKANGTETDYAIPATGSVWKQITIKNINVTDGTVGVGFHSDANAGNWCHMDNVHLQLQ